MKKCVCCLRKLQLQKDCSGGNQSNNFKFANFPFEKEVLKKPGRYTKEFCDGLRFGRVLCKIIGQG